MIELERVTRIFHPGTANAKQVIAELNLHVAPGEFVTIIGSNGAGKTTLFNLISGNLMPSAGVIRLNGADATTTPEYKRARYIGRIFQDPLRGTASNMSVEDNMMIAHRKGFKWPKISLNRRMRADFRERLQQLEMGLQDRMKENVSNLSGGQRQALTLLMMVMSSPRIILLDEHTAALDPRNATIVMELTARFVRQYRLTTLMITHNMQQAIDFGDRLLMMDGGEIIIDIRGAEKSQLTRPKLMAMFSRIRHKDFDNDEVLLSTAD
jgi:putative ABC transport system ATP-binding protein